ncbi:MAG: hypothetical protein JSU09_04605 [Bacteroidetes bacterium]|nr:hypothetical protein [Bacteroidota bacterium]
MQIKKRIFLLVCWVLLSAGAFAQVAKSPFSTFGWGDVYNRGLAQNQGMGGVGISNSNPWYINNMNPALLVNNYVVSFQAGMQLENRTINDGANSLKNGSGNLNYLVMAFPVKPGKWTTSIGLMPYSGVNYKLNTTKDVIGSNTSVFSEETGSGGINQFYWSNGVRINKYVAVGARVNYLFSSIISESAQTLAVNRLVTFFPSVYERTYVKDLSFSTGLTLQKDSLFKKNYKVSLGFIYDFRTDINTQTTQRIDRRSITGVIIDSTTVANTSGSAVMPQTYGVGLSFGRMNHWTFATDLQIMDYNQLAGFSRPFQTTTGLRAGAGFEITPDPTGLSNFLKRMTYRVGGSYERYPYLVNGNQVKDLGITFGLSMPLGLSTLDFGLKLGKRGSIVENSIEEDYYKFYFGMTFNDRWFIKRKFD